MVSEVREQVFISSTYVDLREERQEVIQTLLEAGCIPSGMELFPASDAEKWDLIKRVIDECDYYLLVIGGRYGSVEPDNGLSYTEMEYDYAVSQGKPVLAFAHGEPGAIAIDKSELKVEAREKLAAFRLKVETRVVKYWTSPSDLGGQVAKSLIHARRTHPAEGWIRASNAMTPEVEAELARLRAQVAELTTKLERKSNDERHGLVAENLAGGTDLHKIPGTIKYNPEGALRSWDESIFRFVVEVEWDEIYAYVAPSMLDEASVNDLRAKLESFVLEEYRADPSIKRPKDYKGTYRSFASDGNLLDDVIVQFYALGLIQKSPKKHVASDKKTYWSLTEAGEGHLMRLRAIRRQPTGPDEEQANAADG